MIDIHSHILPEVDDGSPSLDVSLEMLKNEERQGVKAIVLTPHYKEGKYEVGREKLIEKLKAFQDLANENGIGVELKLGQEIFVTDSVYDKLGSDELLTMNGTKAVMLEFHYVLNSDIADTAYNFKALGYIPIIAHIERYSYIHKTDAVYEIKCNGGLIQVNASSVIGESGKHVQKFVLSLIKEGLVDFVAGDYHSGRGVFLKEAYDLVSKKFGEEMARKLFEENAKKILKI